MKIFMFFLRLLLALGLSSQMSCKTGVFNSSKIKSNEHYPAETMRQPKAVFDIWERHIQEETGGKQIQVDCMPTHFGPKEGVSSRGIVVLYHGFTACPQQYFLVGAKLAELGFDVFLPLMPGQGRMPLADLEWNGQGKDNYFDLPTGEDTSRLEHLAMQMNDMAKAGLGLKIVGGLSGGGGLATASAVAGRDIWNRAIFMAPFYKFRTPLAFLTAIMDRIYPGFSISYGEQCQKDRGVKGKRNGLCGVSVDAMRAMLDYGLSYRRKLAGFDMQTMFIGVEDDQTILNEEMIAAAQENPNASLCLYYKGVPHSMLSRLENLHLDHAWNDSLEDALIKFIAEGQKFPTEGTGEGGMPLCRVVKKVAN